MDSLSTWPGMCGDSFDCELCNGIYLDEEENREYNVYGINFADIKGNIIAHIPDVSTKKELVSDFIELCYTKAVAAVHICDVLEDYLD